MEHMQQLIKGDCLEEMKNIPDKSIDCIICDLPYFGVVKEDFDNQWKSQQEYLDWVRLNIIEYNRILKDGGNIVLFSSRQLNRYICNILDEFFVEKRIIIWARKRGFNNTRGKSLSSGYEPIAYYCKEVNNVKSTFNNIKIKPKTNRTEYTDGILKDGVNLSDVWTDISALPHNSKEKTKHPTQKPIALMERIVNLFSNEGDTILDNCMGSGSTGVACKNTNRNFIGIELDEKYFEIAKERLV